MNTTASPEHASVEALLSHITDEFLQRLDAGQQPDIEDYVQRYPDLADVLRQVLPALTVLRQPLSGEEASADGLISGVLGDFRIVREVGRGGMGVVYEAEQISLGRRVALKVLPFAATMDARQLQRFHNEARAAAGLHQEHIVPVHAVGCERGVHFYAMQFIEGRTLAQLIEQQCSPGAGVSEPTAAYTPQPGDGEVTADTVEVRAEQIPPPAAGATSRPVGDGAYFRRVAEWGVQAAEALEYAHTVGIVHRDIKPANLMVDGHGKLWVTDFGLARTASDSGLTMTGDLLGTLRYMSPEQALARHGLVDHRTDVYSLGVTLYELLTLRAAVEGKDRQEILQKIAFEEPVAPRSLNRAISHELETIVLKAMAKEPAERYATAKELADDLRRFLEDKPVLARRPSLMQRARRWARRNRSLVGSLAAGLLLAAVALGGSVGWVVRDRAVRQDEAERRVSEALAEMEPALQAGNPHAPHLVRAARQAESHLASNLVCAELRGRAEQLLADLAMLEELELIPLTQAGVKDGRFDLGAADEAYAAAFHRYGIDMKKLASPEIGPQLHSRVIAAHLAAALDNWALARNKAGGQGWQELLRLAQEIDPEQDPWRKAFRDAMAAGSGMEEVKKLAATVPVEKLPAASLRLLAAGWMGHMRTDARLAKVIVPILQSGQRRFPADFWLNHQLAMALTVLEPPRLDEALGFYRAAVALRPNSPGVRLNSGFALEHSGRLDEAIAEYRETIRLKKDYGGAHINLGNALRKNGQPDEAIAEYHDAIRLNQDDAMAHYNLGIALHEKGQPEEAAVEFRKAIRFKKDYADAYTWIGKLLGEQGRLDEAIAECREAIRLKNDCPEAHIFLGVALEKKGRLDEAIAEYQEGIRLKKDDHEVYTALGNALKDKGRLDEALAAYHEAIRLKKDYWEAHNGLAIALLAKGRFDDALEECREAVRLKKDSTMARINLGNALKEKGRLDEAIAAYREAIRLKKDYWEAHNGLAIALLAKGRFDDALEECREAVRLKKDSAMAHNTLGTALKEKGRLDDAIIEYREAIRLKKDYPEAHVCLGAALQVEGQVDEAITEYREAMRLKKDCPEAYLNLGAALKDKGRLDDAIAAYREAIRIKKDYPYPHYNLGIVLQEKGQLDDAISAYREAIRIKPDYPEAHCNLGDVLENKGLYAEALIHRRRGHELGSINPRWPYPSAQWLQNCERLVALDRKLPAILSGKEQPADTKERLTLASMCQQHKKHYAAATRFYSEAFAADPKLIEDPATGHRYNAACAAALAGCGQGIDADKLDSKERTRLRRQALDWLWADLALWGQLLDKGPAQARPVVAQKMQHWLKDSDFAGVRNAEALDRLPESERRDWQPFWRDVEALRQRAASPGIKKPLPAKESPKPKP